MTDEIALLKRMYREFNARNVNAVLGAMQADVKWPNGWEGGHVVGHKAVRDYWTRQWAEIDPTVTPQEFEALLDGRLRVRVHQVIKDRAGKLMSDKLVRHTYSFAAGKIRGMEIARRVTNALRTGSSDVPKLVIARQNSSLRGAKATTRRLSPSYGGPQLSPPKCSCAKAGAIQSPEL